MIPGLEATASMPPIRPLIPAGPMLRAFMPENNAVSSWAEAVVKPRKTRRRAHIIENTEAFFTGPPYKEKMRMLWDE
jgi:hypothetical protein